jgi:murein DD-endopeptidase MepM/ murein hydrolase activator NlpD
MNGFTKHVIVALPLIITSLFLSSQFLAVSPTAAQEGTVAQQAAVPLERPLHLPFAAPPSPNTWLMGQPYGNTTGAYRQRFTTYGASGGIHFGVDLSAPCGTEIGAVADGIVFAIDGPFGSPPHNLMIDHPQLGYASMYGHLLELPDVRPGDVVKQGQLVALSGDPGETCYGRTHLHLEIRALDHMTKYNPAMLIEANWNNLALTGGTGRDFARDLEDPRKWQSLYDQPEASTGGPIINDFAYAWPFDWHKRDTDALMPLNQSSFTVAGMRVPNREALLTLAIGRQITRGNCCTQPYWDSTSTQVRFLDQPAPNVPLGIWAIDLAQPEAGPEFITERLGVYSADNAYVAYPNPANGMAVVERLADGQTWEIDTQEHDLNFSPDNQHVLWTAFDENAFSDNREEIVWYANIDGSEPKVLLRERRTDPLGWLSNDELLVSRRIPGSSGSDLFRLSVADGRQTELLQVPQMRGLTFSPDRRYLVYYVTFEKDTQKNGLWLLDLQSAKPAPRKLPFFGAYRWRDNERLIYVPFDPQATEHEFYEYNALTQQTRALFPGGTHLTIANNDWRISPDGDKIVLVAANGPELDGLWVLDLDKDLVTAQR